MLFAFKVLLSSVVISYTSWLAGKKPMLAGLLIALPLTSMLSILFSYAEFKDMNKIADFSKSIFILVPLSLAFFVPFVFHTWLKTNFAVTYLLGIGLLILVYGVFRFFGGVI